MITKHRTKAEGDILVEEGPKGVEKSKQIILESFVKVAPYLNQLFTRDVAVAISNRKQYIYYVPGQELDFKVKPNDIVKEGTLLNRAMMSGKRVIDYVDSKLFGFPYIGIAIPVRDETNGEVIGGVFLGENTSEHDLLNKMAKVLTNNTNEVNVSFQGINSEAQNLARLGQQLSEISTDFINNLKEVDNTIEIIQSITKQTNLLGLNAAIESARVGEAGKGFQVVAHEIRKLSLESSESAKLIKDTLNSVKTGSMNIYDNIETVKEISTRLAQILEQTTTSLNDINTMVQELSSHTDSLMN